MLAQRARDNLAAVAFCNLVGGQDELVFDGHSLRDRPRGPRSLARAPQFAEELLVGDVDLEAPRGRAPARHAPAPGGAPRAAARSGTCGVSSRVRATAEATAPAGAVAPSRSSPRPRSTRRSCSALRDYVEKNGFEHVVIGLSGGIDSALVALHRRRRARPRARHVVVMPSPYSSDGHAGRRARAGRNLGVEHARAADRPSDGGLRGACWPSASTGREPDITEENLQARIRGNLLMALSNKFGWLVLTTGNKSEMSVGYSTLYGDTAGGFAVIKDVPKTLVYRLVRLAQRARAAAIPRSRSRSSTRPPSAELRPDQRDEDSLPPYDVLDRDPRGLRRGGPRPRAADRARAAPRTTSTA